MSNKHYLTWMGKETPSAWTNDSAVMEQVTHALDLGAIGCTTNPPLSYEALVTDTELYNAKLAAIDQTLSDDEWALEAMGLVVKEIAKRVEPIHLEKGSYFGCVRAQVQPNLRDDREGMLRVGKIIASWGKNVMVKIPATEAGIWVLEELAALGIPTNPTVVTTVSQAIAAGKAYENGIARAKAAGITPAWSTCAFVMGRMQDYMVELNEQRGLGLAVSDLAWAALALVKRSEQIFREQGFHSVLMPAAFRSALQVEQLTGGVFCSTIHPKVQKLVEEADQAGTIARERFIDAPVDEEAVARVAAAIPEYRQAYEVDGLTLAQFGSFGAVVMTMDNFEITGWQKLVALKKQFA